MTTNAVPSTLPEDLLLNVGILDAVVNSTAQTFTDRLGNVKPTVLGAIESLKAYNSRGAWVTGTAYALKDLVSNGGTWYACVVAHTASASFATDAAKWRVHQGLTTADLAASGTSAATGHLPSGSGAIATTVAKKLQEVRSIFDFAAFGSDDGTTDITAAYVTACTTVGAGGKIVFPKTNTGVFVIGAYAYAITNGIEFDVESGCLLKLLDLGYIHPNAKFTRPTKARFTAINSDYVFTDSATSVQADKPMWLGYSDRDQSVTKPLVCNSELTFKSVAWSAGDAFTVESAASVSTSGAQLTPAADNKFHAGFYAAKPGEEISAQFVAASNVKLLAIARTANGYFGLYADLLDTSVPDFFYKTNGVTGVAVSLPYMGSGSHSSYAPNNSVWTVRVVDSFTVAFLLNGFEIKRYTTTAPVIEVGFGAFPTAAGASVVLQDWVKRNGVQDVGGGAISLSVFGDSITDKNAFGSWPSLLPNILDASYGLRINTINNYGHSGDSSAQQMALCTPSNIAASNMTLIMIGVNDIQNLISEVTYAANLTSMISTVQAAGQVCIVAIPTMFYTQGQAPGHGQASQYYAAGKGIRAKCARVCADMGVKLIDMPAKLGPILSNWVNASLDSVQVALGRDPIVYDNIHPTQLGRFTIARAFAEAIVGAMHSAPTGKIGFTALDSATLSAGWTMTTQQPYYARSIDGTVSLQGVLDSGTKTDGTVIYTLPQHLRPFQTFRPVVSANNGYCRLVIDAATGQVSISGFTGAYLSLDGVSFPTFK